MHCDISILIPGIRPNLWQKVYDSIDTSFGGSWEVIFIGPNPVPDWTNMPNAKFIQSYAAPMVCRQQALCTAVGDYICYAADDVLFCDGALDEAFLSLVGKDGMDLVVGKYLEGEESQKTESRVMRDDGYWYLNYHGFLHTVTNRFPGSNYYLINTGLISRKLMNTIGGWDCQFEACAMGCVDLSLRLQIHGAQCKLQNTPIFVSTHLPGYAGDHKPIHDGQVDHDMPLFLKIWERPEALTRTCIELENWKHYPQRWGRRFGQA